MIQRPEILLQLKRSLRENDLVVAALAGTTVDCYQTMHRRGNLYLVGMGMVSQVGLGLALALPSRRIIALDTDGSLLLSPSILPVVNAYKPRNLRILVFDNEHIFGSRGGPSSQTAFGTDLVAVARGSGIQKSGSIDDRKDIEAKVSWFLSEEGPVVLIAKVEAIRASGDGPTINGPENKFQLVRFIEETEKIDIFGVAK